MYYGRMLAKARSKYGKPNYHGRIYKNAGTNVENQMENVREMNEKIQNKTMKTAEEIWDMILKSIKEEISPVSYETWIQPCKPLIISGTKLVLLVENGFSKELVNKRYLVELQIIAKYVTKEAVTEIKLITEEEYKIVQRTRRGK